MGSRLWLMVIGLVTLIVYVSYSGGCGGGKSNSGSSGEQSIPLAPSNLLATPISTSQINLSWIDNSGNELAIKLERKLDAGGTYGEILSLPVGSTVYSDKSLVEGKTYYYRLRASNVTGDSPYSNEASATTRLYFPNNLTANPIAPSQVNLLWTDNSANESGYKLERSTDSNNWTEITATGPNINYYYDNGRSELTTYYYRVKAYNSGNESDYSVSANATTPLSPPTSLNTTVISPTRINLVWLDNSGKETGYKIERKAGSSGTYGLIYTIGANATAYSDTTGLIEGIAYYYRVYAYSGSNISAYSNEASSAIQLNGPTSLNASTASSSAINLTWTDNSANEDGFRIERSTTGGGSGFTQIATVSAGITSYNSTGLFDGTRYYYRVRAYNTITNSPYSNEGLAVTTLNAPQLVDVNAVSSSQIDIVWTDFSVSETEFRIERSPDDITYTQVAVVGAGVQSYTDTTALVDGTKYYYRVRAYNNVAGYSPYSTVLDATTTIRAPTSLVASTISFSRIDLSWADNSGAESGFRLERSLASGMGFGQIAAPVANTTSYSNTGLADGTVYYYRIQSYNTAYGDSVWSNEAVATTTVAAPTLLSATAVSSSWINLSWSDNSTTENGYEVERSTTGGGIGFSLIVTLPADTEIYSDVNLNDGTTYYYRVRAHNAIGYSPYCPEANAQTPLNLPTALIATAISQTIITLTWIDNSDGESEFRIERSSPTNASFNQITTVPANTTAYTDTGLTKNTPYYYRVRAYNVSSGTSYPSNEATATTWDDPPNNAPTALTATAVVMAIAITWTDNSSNELGFKIERSITGGGADFGEVATVPADITTYSNTGLTDETRYYYRVRAYNTGGYSAYTNEADATTPLNPPAGLISEAISPTGIALTWTDTTDSESEFRIERSDTGGGIGFSQVATITADTAVYTDTGLTSNTVYYYRVRAYNSTSGNSAYTDETNAKTWRYPPVLSARATDTTIDVQIALTWTDTSSDELGFKIERGLTNTSFSQITTVGADIQTYTDTGLAFYTTYYYRVRAYYLEGDGRYSNIVPARNYEGRGVDGSLTVNTSFNINTQTNGFSGRVDPDGVIWSITNNVISGQNTVSSGVARPSGFASGDEIIIINLKGDPPDYANVGLYEFKKITGLPDANSITINGTLANVYNGTINKIMVQRIPNYTDVTVNASSTLTCNAWDGASGGVIVFRANGILTLTDASSFISANGLGHRGGTGGTAAGGLGGASGESYIRDSYPSGGGAGGYDAPAPPAPSNVGGGGGGAGDPNGSSTAYIGYAGTFGPAGGGGAISYRFNLRSAASGGGGGHGSVGLGGTASTGYGATNGADGSGTTGGTGGNADPSTSQNAGGGGGGGMCGNSATLTTRAYLGAGGGAGGSAETYKASGSGGKGGGFVFIAALTINNNGTISANGNNGAAGSAGASVPSSGSGGGGAGGSILIWAGTLNNTFTIVANGGAGGNSGDTGGLGGAGGGGRTYTRYNTISGNPPSPNYYYGGNPYE